MLTLRIAKSSYAGLYGEMGRAQRYSSRFILFGELGLDLHCILYMALQRRPTVLNCPA